MDKEITFQDYLYVIFTKRWVVISIFLVTLGATIIYTFSVPKVYKATATVMMEPGSIAGSPFRGSRFYYPVVNIRNYCEILNSKAVAERAVDKLKEAGFNFSFLNRPEPAESLLLRRSINPVMDSDIIKVDGIGRTTREAVAVSNAIVDAFMEEQLSSIKKGIAERREFLEAQIPQVQSNLEESERRIKEFKEKNKIVSLPDEVTELVEELADFDRLYNSSGATYKSLQNRLNFLKNQLAEQKLVLVNEIAEVSSPYILELRRQLIFLETDYSLYLVQGLLESDPKLMDLKESIERTKVKLIEETKKIVNKQIPSLDPLSSSQELVDKILELEVEVSAQEAERNAFLEIKQNYEKKLYSLPTSEFELAQLERRKKVNAIAYELLMRYYKETQVSEAGTVSNVRVVDRAGTSKAPIKPKKRLNLILGTVFGIILGIGGAFVADYVGASIKTPKDIRIHVNLPVFGSIPKVSKPNLMEHSRNSPIAEAYRTIRTNIGFANPDCPAKTILVTSSVPREGKSTIASNLGIIMTQLGKKVLLVDADLRKPALAKVFGVENDKGVTDILIKKVDWSSVISSTKIENLNLLASGKIPPNPSELLGSQQMDALIKQLNESFDYIIFDAPPVISVTDAVILSSKLDGILLVVEANRTNKLALSHAKENFERVNAKILGVILNKVPSGYAPYGYPHYHSYYRYYTSKEEA